MNLIHVVMLLSCWMNVAKMQHHQKPVHSDQQALDAVWSLGHIDEAVFGGWHHHMAFCPWIEQGLQNDNTTKIVNNQTWLMWLELSQLKTKHLPSHFQTCPSSSVTSSISIATHCSRWRAVQAHWSLSHVPAANGELPGRTGTQSQPSSTIYYTMIS